MDFESARGPANLVAMDLDGNTILFDQPVWVLLARERKGNGVLRLGD